MIFSRLNISNLWFLFLLICNIYAFFFILQTGNLYEIYHNELAPEGWKLFVLLITILLFYLFFYFLFISFSKMKVNPKFVVDDYLFKDRSLLSNAIIFMLVIYIMMVIFFDLGKAGGEELSHKSLFLSFFAFFRIDYFSLLYVSLVGLSKKTKLIIFLVLISSLARGWLGDILVVILLLAALSGREWKSFFNKKYLFLSFFILLFFTPLMEVRSYYRLGGIDAVFNGVYSGLGFDFFDYFHDIFMRFQQIYSVSYYYNNSYYFDSLYSQGYIRPLYLEGVVENKLYNMLGGHANSSLGYIFADTNRVLIEGRKTAFTAGLLPYISMSPISLFYVLFLVIVSGFLSACFKKVPATRFLIFYYLMTLFSFGWINAYNSFLFTLVLFLIVVIFSKKNG